MLTPSSVRSIEPPVATYEVISTEQLAKHIQTCGQQKVTSRLDVKIQADSAPPWSLFFFQGHLAWCASEVHPLRRWNRQLFQYCPQLANGDEFQGTTRPQYWDYEALTELTRQKKIEQKQLASVFTGNALEILFDIIQAEQQLPKGAELKLVYRKFSQDILDSMPIMIRLEHAWLQAEQAWSIWRHASLVGFSPNLAPVIWNDDELLKLTSRATYQNLSTLIDGNWTLRDLAIKLKQPLVSLTQSLMPYVHQGVIGLTSIGDINHAANPVSAPLVAYIEDSRYDSSLMGQILAQAGYRFINIRDVMQALPILLQHKPNLIFLDLLMPVINGYEVCAQIRRISAFIDTPVIIVTSKDGFVDRVRAKLVGSSDFLAKPIKPEKVLAVLQRYLTSSRLGN